MYYKIVFPFFFIPIFLFGQELPGEILFSYEIESKIANSELRSSSASYYYTFIGDYLNAVSTYDIPISWGVDTIDLVDLKTAGALSTIREEARDKRVIIISESHLKPQHRIFASQLIDTLSALGFNHLGIETLGHSRTRKNQLEDSLLQERGFPLWSGTGYYAREPQMAALIRNAIRRNYHLFAYESVGQTGGKDRDEIQADNIIEYMKDSGAEKVILLCGWHHAIESDTIKRRRSYWMAKYIKDKTAIDPLTIYQDNFTEKFIENQHPFLDKSTLERPAVFVDQLGRVIRISEHVDVEVIHPKTRFIKGRPSWLWKSDDHVEYYFDSIPDEINYPILVMAFKDGEEDGGVAVDLFEMKDHNDRKPLILRPGNYVVTLYSRTTKQSLSLTIR